MVASDMMQPANPLGPVLKQTPFLPMMTTAICRCISQILCKSPFSTCSFFLPPLRDKIWSTFAIKLKEPSILEWKPAITSDWSLSHSECPIIRFFVFVSDILNISLNQAFNQERITYLPWIRESENERKKHWWTKWQTSTVETTESLHLVCMEV